MKEIVAKSYIGVMHYLKFNKLNYTSIDNFFLAKFQSQIKHLVDFSDREWYSLERCRRLVWNFEKQNLRIKYKKVNHGNKSMLLGHEYILWDLTQRYIRGRFQEIKSLKIKYKKIPKKISKNFQSSLEFLLYDDEIEEPKKQSKKRSAGRSAEQLPKRSKLA